jgi:hypothetical protein
MSFLSVENLSNAASIVALSVLTSTTRKFFWLSGGAVTCCRANVLGSIGSADRGRRYARRCQQEAAP